MPVSCLPCTKRKVRCDREKPCSHCKRRGDVCEYPNLASTSRNSPRTKAVGTSESRRIEKLEEYIRRLGGDPNHIQSSARLSPTPLNERSSLEHALSVDKLIPDQETGRHEGGSSSTPITSFRNSEQARLVEHNEETTYVEAFVPIQPILFLKTDENLDADRSGTAGARPSDWLTAIPSPQGNTTIKDSAPHC